MRAQVKGVLTDQSLIAGVGNAYSDEILWQVGLSPFKPAANLSDEEIENAARRPGGDLAGCREAVRGDGRR